MNMIVANSKYIQPQIHTADKYLRNKSQHDLFELIESRKTFNLTNRLLDRVVSYAHIYTPMPTDSALLQSL